MTDYEIEYQRHDSACGEPSREIVDFFDTYRQSNATVLDLGCGQGRDALMIAAHGHTVHGVDIAPTGIAQFRERARLAELCVEGEVADIREYEARQTYDVVVLDRVIHMLASSDEKRAILAKAATAAADDGYVLVVDTPSNIPLVEGFFQRGGDWEIILHRKGFRFFRRHTTMR